MEPTAVKLAIQAVLWTIFFSAMQIAAMVHWLGK